MMIGKVYEENSSSVNTQEAPQNKTDNSGHKKRRVRKQKPHIKHKPDHNDHHQHADLSQSAYDDDSDGCGNNRAPHHHHYPQQHYQHNASAEESYQHGDESSISDEQHIESNDDEPATAATVLEIKEIQSMSTDRLINFSSNLNLKMKMSAKRSVIAFEILKYFAKDVNTILVAEGTLDITHDGYGFLRFPLYHYKPSHEDIYVHSGLIKKFDLRQGDTIQGIIRMPRDKEKYLALYRINKINFQDAGSTKKRVFFEDCTPVPPTERIFLETTPDNLAGRIIDLISPIGKGQRALIVAPPRSGKTMLLKSIARSIKENNPEIHLIILLINERPEEVTDMQRSVDAEVAAATFDEQPERHTHIAEMVMEKATRLAETGADVCILLDSITRLARAYNIVQPHSGKVLSGGVDANALHKPKRLFGLARKLYEGGSITIIATALSETGSRMDEVIFEEFKGTGNCEIVLNRSIAEKRIFPAIEPEKSGTRQEEKLFAYDELAKCILLRQELSKYALNEKVNLLISRLKSTKSNFEFLLSIS